MEGGEMSDTPISDSTAHNVAELGMLCRSLERDLTASNAIIRQQQLLDEENLRLQERIKRLEREIEVLRFYGNKGCTAVADKILARNAKI
jgi:hypothetical protein